ncbi:COG4280 domain-containing protein [Herbaspirillum camelliae]|uniref:COG4280 domain-containing protein n=1 Tax=Herbaspirillum camelliae TaxID=1892903 RepID=UPI000A85802E|nr:TMEM165/GDT1 family protein [Herbaspirillum camelliae]
MIHIAQAAPTILASFMASLVEFVEALTVVLAVGTVRGWRPAIMGTVTALCLLLLMVVCFGSSLAAIPLPVIQLVVGTLLLMFGLRWLRKAVLRSAGVIALHDEAATYQKETELLRNGAPAAGSWDKTAFFTAFKIVMLEGVEVVFIVIAIGASGQLIGPASLGAIAALILVVLLGLWLHRPLANVPENTLKFGVGILLAAFGTFWAGEGVHIEWPGADWVLLALIAAYFVVAQVALLVCRKLNASRAVTTKEPSKKSAPRGWMASIWDEFIGLFVDDGFLAVGIVLWVGAAWVWVGAMEASMPAEAVLFLLGLTVLLWTSAVRAARA